MISCLLLAAGLSSRFGSPKALAGISGKPAIVILQEKLTASCVDAITIVLGAHCEVIKPHLLNHKKIATVYNKDYLLGQTSSFQAGLRYLPQKTTGIMLLPVDYPFIEQKTFDQLVDSFVSQSPLFLIPTYKRQKGHPPIFSITLKPKFLKLNQSQGINSVIWKNQSSGVFFPVDDPGVVKNFNTREELSQLLRPERHS